MFGDKKAPQKAAPQAPDGGKPATPVPLLTVVGDHARMEGKFEIADSIQIECEVGGELNVGVKLVIGGKGAVNANVKTVDAIIMAATRATWWPPATWRSRRRVGSTATSRPTRS